MRKILAGIIISAMFTTTAFANVIPPVIQPPPVKFVPHGAGGAGGAGAAAVGGFIGFVAILAGYDLVRRTSCIGDPWRLGGPGFSEPYNETSNVLKPLHLRGGCGKAKKAKHRRAVVAARG